MINGIINIYKEKGYTSHDVVAKMRGILRQRKIGHTGTLDPDAEGVLPVCLGCGTKLCDMLEDSTKEYVAEFRLGLTTDTQDISGEVLSEHSTFGITEEMVVSVVGSFLGEYDQLPPMYSAKKINGKKLYELAREGRTVERVPSKIYIHEIEILSMNLPDIKIRAACSKGTYIRTLCFDIGEKLGTGAVMTKLLRTRAGQFKIEDAITLARLEEIRDAEELLKYVFPVEDAFEKERAVYVKKDSRKLIDNGNSLFHSSLEETEPANQNSCWQNGEKVRVYNDEKLFCGLYRYDQDTDCFKTVKMFPMNE